MEPTKCSSCKHLPSIRPEDGQWVIYCGDAEASAPTLIEAVRRWNKFQGRRRIGLPLNPLNGGVHANPKKK